MSSAPVCRATACSTAVRRADRHLLIKAGILVCVGIFMLSGCSGEAAPAQHRVGSAPGELNVATAMGQSMATYPDPWRSAASPQTDTRNQSDALVLFTSMRKARVLHGLH